MQNDRPAPRTECNPMLADPQSLPLARFVEGVRVITPPPGREYLIERYPDGRTSLVFRVLEGGRTGDLWLAGPHTRASFKNKRGVERAVIFRFKPGGAVPLLGVAASELTDRMVPLQDVWGQAGCELCDELIAARDAAQVKERIYRALAVRSCNRLHSTSARLARRAVRLLEGGNLRVGSVAEQLGVSVRHLHRVFTENVGVGPKEFARTVRLHRALSLAATSRDWARIAADTGYCDQAHLIGDFRQLIGLTPSALSKRRQLG